MKEEKTFLFKPNPGEIQTFKDYSTLTEKTWDGDNAILRCTYGIAGEAGEVAEVMKKHLRGDFDWEIAKEKLIKEMGDVLYYLDTLARSLEIDLRLVAEKNIFKLFTRFNNDLIHGDGSDREEEINE